MKERTPDTRWRRKWFLRCTLAILVVSLLVGLGISWRVASELVRPRPRTVGDPPADFEAETVRIPSDSGSVLAGWYAPRPNAKGAVLLLHGFQGTRLQMLDRARLLAKEGYSVLLFDFQAHGESPGEHVTVGYEEQKDVRAALDYLRTRQPEMPVAIVGLSMGGAAAILARPEGVDAMVLESVYPSIAEAIGNRVGRRLGRLGPVASWVLLTQVRIRLGISPDDLRPIDALGEVKCPVLVMAGAKDRATTIEETQRMFDCITAPKELVVFPEAGHANLHSTDAEKYRERLLGFLEKSLGNGISESSSLARVP